MLHSAKGKEEQELELRTDSIFSHLWDQTKKFGSRCGRFIFITDAGIAIEMTKLLEDARQSQCADKLPEESGKISAKIIVQAKKTFPEIYRGNSFHFSSTIGSQRPR